MLVPMTQREQDLTVKNVLAACKDINKLNSRGYKFLYLAYGFIAHYNLYGFKENFSRWDLREEILHNATMNVHCNRYPGDVDYEYYKTKANVYTRIVEAL